MVNGWTGNSEETGIMWGAGDRLGVPGTVKTGKRLKELHGNRGNGENMQEECEGENERQGVGR